MADEEMSLFIVNVLENGAITIMIEKDTPFGAALMALWKQYTPQGISRIAERPGRNPEKLGTPRDAWRSAFHSWDTPGEPDKLGWWWNCAWGGAGVFGMQPDDIATYKSHLSLKHPDDETVTQPIRVTCEALGRRKNE